MLKQYLRLNTVIGISIKINSDNSTTIQACKIHTSKNQLDFEKKALDLNTLEEFNNEFISKDYLSVNLTGKGILHKRIDRIDEINSSNFESILPNAVFNDFYIQNFISGKHSFVSVIRKTEAEKWLSSIKNMGFIPVMLSLGPFPVNSILPQINTYDNSIIFDGHVIGLNIQNEWETYTYDEYKKSPFPVKLENEPIDEKLLISYSAAFQAVFAGFSESIEAHVMYLEDQLRSITANKRTKFLAVGMLIFFFIILLVNFLIFWSLNSSNQAISSKLGQISNGNLDTKTIQKSVETKENDLKLLGWDDDLDKAYFIDQLAMNLPEQISWNSLEINPVDLLQSRNSGSIKLLDRTIILSGFSDKIVPVNNWIADISEYEWVKNVQLQSYIIDQEINKGKFILMIKY
ncbi:hypothetical protein [Daejeonella oryzae]|uniref:hypothetical protein n=1 Tax=Daejeonella oryzae TaxID=1122943 RepID=UPI000412CFAF|nr:hypothetical protein [Daejeonella oryzae]